MCVACYLRDPGLELGYHKKIVRYYIGGLRNIVYLGRRGEGNPAPWIMLRTSRYGLQLELGNPLRYFPFWGWRTEVSLDPHPVKSYHFGNVVFAKRTKCAA